MTWVGWVWDGEWLSVCHADDMRACHVELLAYARAHGVPCSRTALTGGHYPPWKV